MRIIKVEELSGWGFESGTKYFKSLNKAKKYFKQLIKSHKDDLANDEDCGHQEKPVVYEGKPFEDMYKKGSRRKRVNLECWYSSNTECGTEYDTELITIALDEITIDE
ncbi:hypothetical protein [Clostridium tertium]|uniref:hypothetical protein n=1 Tax=Clostridium tertium TaxID=1559 RepID=UPI0023B3328F|nr:hypothetical protein [Clostridium tertium]